MDWKYLSVVKLDLGRLLQGQMRICKPKSAYNLLIIGPRGLESEIKWARNLLMCSDVGPLLQGQTRIPKLRSLRIIGPRGL